MMIWAGMWHAWGRRNEIGVCVD